MARQGSNTAAKHCHVSAAYMTRLFKRYDTETPLACLTMLKMSQAMIKLRLPETQVKAVAAELGYKSAAHFSRAFKAWSSLSPTEIRSDGSCSYHLSCIPNSLSCSPFRF